MHSSILTFLRSNLSPEDVSSKRVLEVGSQDVNGSPRAVLCPLQPQSYLGIDSAEGPGVDQVCKADDLESTFGSCSFDIALSTEMLEHVQDWKTVVSQMKRVVKPSGLLVITTRSPGFPYHPYPIDVWRFTASDFREIFRDMEILVLEPDPEVSGIFLKARKPGTFVEADLSHVKVLEVVPDKPKET